mmetsp:Transcript_28315/g.57976  ORF Transcript_28315/g.57976 Transcript_28315/m.57976 type:complete len:362 (+) Transcript_28315:165-1250(+)
MMQTRRSAVCALYFALLASWVVENEGDAFVPSLVRPALSAAEVAKCSDSARPVMARKTLYSDGKRERSSSKLRMSGGEQHTTNLYEILGITPTASMCDIKQAFRETAKRCHPDTTHRWDVQRHTTDRFVLATSAYQTLIDPILRAKYDVENGMFECALERLTEQQQQGTPGNVGGIRNMSPCTLPRKSQGCPKWCPAESDPAQTFYESEQPAMYVSTFGESETEMFKSIVEMDILARNEVLGNGVRPLKKDRQREHRTHTENDLKRGWLNSDFVADFSRRLRDNLYGRFSQALLLAGEGGRGVPSAGGRSAWDRPGSNGCICMVKGSFSGPQTSKSPLCGTEIHRGDCTGMLQLQCELDLV